MVTFKADFVSLRGGLVVQATEVRMALEAAKQKKKNVPNFTKSPLNSSPVIQPLDPLIISLWDLDS